MKPSRSETILNDKKKLPTDTGNKTSSIASADSSKTLINEEQNTPQTSSASAAMMVVVSGPARAQLTTEPPTAATTSAESLTAQTNSRERENEGTSCPRFTESDKSFLSSIIKSSVEKSCEATYNRLEGRLSLVEERSSKNQKLITKFQEEFLAEHLKIYQRIQAIEAKPTSQATSTKQTSTSALIFRGVKNEKMAKKIIRDLGVTLSGLINVTPAPKLKNTTIIEFSCHWDKSSTYRERTKLKQKGHLGVFINEVLNPSQGKLFFLTRCAKKQGLIKSTWTQDGNIFVSKEIDGEQQMAEVKSQEHLLQLVPRLVVPEDKPEGKTGAATKKKWSSSKVHQAPKSSKTKKKNKSPSPSSSSSSSSSSEDSDSDKAREEGEIDSGSEDAEPKSDRKLRSRQVTKKAGSRRKGRR